MANWARGLASGLETGVRIGDLLEQRRQREELAKAYGLAPQEQQAPLATPEQIGRAQAETQALAAQDAEMFGLAPQDMQRYAPAMPQEGARTGMSTYRLGEQVLQRAPTQAEIDAARTRAAADVYGRYGDTARREELMRGLRAEQRAQTAEERAAQQFETQQQEAALRIAETQRLATERANTDLARKDLAERKAKGPLTMQDFNEIGAKYNLDPTKFVQDDEVLETKQIKDTKRALSQAAMRGEDGLNAFLADKFDPDKSDNIVPKLSKDRAGNIVVTYGDRVLQEYGAHKNVMSLVGGVINLIDQNPFETLKTLSELDYRAAATKAQEASAEASQATTQLRGLQGRAVREQTAATAEAARIRAEYEALTPEEQAGAKGQGLIRQFNMANVKAGATVPLGTAARAAPELSAPVMKRYEELIKSNRWQHAPNIDAKIKMLEAEGISPAAVGLVSPVDALIATMRSGGQPAPAAAPPRATPAGQQLLGLADVFLPPPAPTPRVPTTSAERMRGLYLGQ